MIATLPMYDRPDTRAALTRLWHLIRDGLNARGIDAPTELSHDAPLMEPWGRDDLVLSQICNLPYRARFKDRLTLIGAADYGVAGVPAGYYNSLWLVRKDDPARQVEDCAGYRFAFNDPLSQSGWGAPVIDAQERGLTLTPHLQTGAHLVSMAAVADGGADLAAVDAVTWELAQRSDPIPRGLRVVGQTFASPGMTFVTAKGQDPARYFAAISSAIDRLAMMDKATLSLRGIVRLPDVAYALPLPPKPWAAEVCA